MSQLTSRESGLAFRPTGIPSTANFTLEWTASEPLKDQEVLVRNLFTSVDPYMRGRMDEGKSYVAPFEIGKPLEGGAVGDVIESRAPEFKPGDVVTSKFGWREYFTASPKNLRRPDSCRTSFPKWYRQVSHFQVHILPSGPRTASLALGLRVRGRLVSGGSREGNLKRSARLSRTVALRAPTGGVLTCAFKHRSARTETCGLLQEANMAADHSESRAGFHILD
jgi:hypothetical protein